MSALKEEGLEIILESSDSSDCDESDSVKELKAKISRLEDANLLLTQRNVEEKWSYQEKLDKFQKEIKGKCFASPATMQ